VPSGWGGGLVRRGGSRGGVAGSRAGWPFVRLVVGLFGEWIPLEESAEA
jgi:hypothetical protein